jgi:2-polyprenyl-3-methyl-5-hydroxy-6-metoxy-1,4-benzoquinol methylase
MSDAAKELYDRIALRKDEAGSPHTYDGGNGRIDRAVDLVLNDDFTKGTLCHLVDVGGATGNLGYALRDHFLNRTVIDIVEDCRGPAEAKGNMFMCCNVDLEGLPIADEMADLVVALDFIEHILDPGRFARECHRILRPGGMVLINTPNIQFWGHLSELVQNGSFPHTSGDREVYHGGHTAFFNRRDMHTIFGDAGFTSHRMHTRGLKAEPPPPIWISLARYPDATLQLSYRDLVFSCRKP